MVDLGGGVMENANLNLDRYGLPRIPGSAAKGCARRMSLQALHDWIAAGTERPAPDDACAPCCTEFTTPAEMLAAIARIFGWTPEDWKTDRNRDAKSKMPTVWKSDFAWACASHLDLAPTGQDTTARGNAPGEGPSTNPSPEGAQQNVRQILEAARSLLPPHPTFAGTIAFLPASPNRGLELKLELELDVLTPHHTIYYSAEPDKKKNRSKWEEWNAHRNAPDTEDPVPVFFPAVKPQQDGDFFTFPLIPLRLDHKDDLTHAKLWLANGLELLGLGAKTNAGYGWFEVPELADQRQAWDAIRAAAMDAKAASIADEEAEEFARKNAGLLAIQPNTELLVQFEQLNQNDLRARINKFQFDPKFWPKEPDEEATDVYQVSLYHYLTTTNRTLYDEEIAKSKSKILTALRQLAEKFARTLPE